MGRKKRESPAGKVGRGGGNVRKRILLRLVFTRIHISLVKEVREQHHQHYAHTRQDQPVQTAYVIYYYVHQLSHECKPLSTPKVFVFSRGYQCTCMCMRNRYGKGNGKGKAESLIAGRIRYVQDNFRLILL